MTNIVPIFQHLTPRKRHVVIVLDRWGRIEGIYTDNTKEYIVTIIDKENNEYEKEANIIDINELHPNEGMGFRIV